MGRFSWFGWSVLAIWLAGLAAACDGGGTGGAGGGGTGGAGGSGASGGTGSGGTTAFACPMKSDACNACRNDKCAGKCTSQTCQMKYVDLQTCVCTAQASGQSYGSCGNSFEVGDAEANAFSNCLDSNCKKECAY